MAGSRVFRHLMIAAAGAVLLFPLSAVVHTQAASTLNVSPNAYDTFVASRAANAVHRASPANTPAGRAARPKDLASPLGKPTPPTPGGPTSAPRYPGDVQYHGGAVVKSTQQYLIYVNLATSASCHTVATCWGNPSGFLKDLTNSDFIHVVDQYVGKTNDGRYTVSNTTINVNYSGPTVYTDNDVLTIVHAVVQALSLPTGDGSLFHVFLTPGQDECFDSTFSECYSPDNLSTFFFCAYHGSVDFNDVGHVLYSVEPFQNTYGCQTRPNTPNGQLADSTNDVLSHETFEAISDPDLDAWWNSLGGGMYGDEMADECFFLISDSLGNVLYSDPSNVTLNGKHYAVQPEYDNASHACTVSSKPGPGGPAGPPGPGGPGGPGTRY